jgi:hypothetical protein
MLPNYPTTLLRGIPNKSAQFFDSQGEVTGNVFRPFDGQNPENGYYEISINWEDNKGVENFTVRESLSDGSFHYKGGVARVSLEKIGAMQSEAMWDGSVKYCRAPIIGINDYHGNLLLNKDKVENKTSKKALLARMKFIIIEVISPIS